STPCLSCLERLRTYVVSTWQWPSLQETSTQRLSIKLLKTCQRLSISMTPTYATYVSYGHGAGRQTISYLQMKLQRQRLGTLPSWEESTVQRFPLLRPPINV